MIEVYSFADRAVPPILTDIPNAPEETVAQTACPGNPEHLSAYLKTLLRHVPAGVVIADVPTGQILYATQRMQEGRGHPVASPKNIADYTARRGFHPDGAAYAPADWPLARAVTTGEVVRDERIDIEDLSGARLAFLVSAAPVRDTLGNVLASIAIEQDITEHKHTTDALKNSIRLETEARLEAEAANRFKGQFIAMVSHELRTPLNPIAMTLTALELDPRLPTDLRDDIAMLRRNIAIETRLIDDLLDVTSAEKGRLTLDLKPTRIHAMLQEVVEIVAAESLDRKQTVSLDLKAHDDAVGADTVRLQQVFCNVMKNAIKFTPIGGQILIRTSSPEPGAIVIEVLDGGMGIVADDLSRIFGAFEQVASHLNWHFGGLGIGLTSCQAIVDLHGGSISATSTAPGKGACIRVELPVGCLIGDASPPLPATVRERSDAVRILVVEDHVDTLRVLRRLLESIGYLVATAESAASAMSYVTANDFDVLLSDIGLPDRNGWELVKQIKKIQNVPAIAISGFGSTSDIKRSRDAGFYGHLTKPLDFQLLQSTIAHAVQKSRTPHVPLVVSVV
jgi:signal transduction histidine kinase/ActR/RegA family two-component response regulator